MAIHDQNNDYIAGRHVVMIINRTIAVDSAKYIVLRKNNCYADYWHLADNNEQDLGNKAFLEEFKQN